MIKAENIRVWNIAGAAYSARNAMNSWDDSDSDIDGDILGEKDLALLRKLYVSSLSGDNHAHRKALRSVFVSIDIIAPLYWWKQMDQYKVGVTSNSCSTMHKIAEKEFTPDDFSHEHLFDRQDIYHGFSDNDEPKFEDMPRMAGSAIDENGNRVWFTPYGFLRHTCDVLNHFRKLYLQETDPEEKKAYWWQMIQLLPSSYNQRRTVTMNYENAVTIIKQRSGHKLDEWDEFVDILKGLPYVKEIMALDKSAKTMTIEIPETGIGDLSDGYHTFNDLYYQRMMLFAAIVNANKDKSWKSYKHEDGENCFGGGWFIVGIDTPEGSYTYHYENQYFDIFDCEALERAKHWDGHTDADVTRLLSLVKN